MTTQVHRVNGDAEAAEEDDEATEESDQWALHRVHPSTKPVAIRFVAYLVAGIAAVLVFLDNPELLGSRDVTNIGLLITQVLVVIALVRQVVKFVRLRHTEYIVTEGMVTIAYQLLGRSETRQVPFERVRSHELRQGRIESQLDLGTITLNQGLGGIALANVPKPFDVYESIREQTEL
ncbi:PH domain-containing protein [Haloarcula salinisoli]|uniref:PH domain-containing protein n=1 Tax=Haloarcula salinisoli TaxID=2487746 RepID=A0A8J7YDE8_9EURY|nr:PH domain-containing protein [Halomicroarcula salinisoli]MBX0285125.1 PH domain-containing protein [Halomicroarcula salinisoli]MBX0303397.1 PH domain-containing protein [Halomicroarcula salinisoli]